MMSGCEKGQILVLQQKLTKSSCSFTDLYYMYAKAPAV